MAKVPFSGNCDRWAGQFFSTAHVSGSALPQGGESAASPGTLPLHEVLGYRVTHTPPADSAPSWNLVGNGLATGAVPWNQLSCPSSVESCVWAESNSGGPRIVLAPPGTFTRGVQIPTPFSFPFPLKLRFPGLSPQAEILFPSLVVLMPALPSSARAERQVGKVSVPLIRTSWAHRSWAAPFQVQLPANNVFYLWQPQFCRQRESFHPSCLSLGASQVWRQQRAERWGWGGGSPQMFTYHVCWEGQVSGAAREGGALKPTFSSGCEGGG